MTPKFTPKGLVPLEKNFLMSYLSRRILRFSRSGKILPGVIINTFAGYPALG